MISTFEFRKIRRRERKKQLRINNQLKRRLFGHLIMSPCCYCLTVFLVDELTIEHVTPLCMGGTNDPTNIALACSPCNHKKGRESWLQKKRDNKKRYEQYSSKH